MEQHFPRISLLEGQVQSRPTFSSSQACIPIVNTLRSTASAVLSCIIRKSAFSLTSIDPTHLQQDIMLTRILYQTNYFSAYLVSPESALQALLHANENYGLSSKRCVISRSL